MRILVVDDDEAVILACRRYFAKRSATVEAATAPRDALAALERGAFDVVICDYQLRTDLTGIDVLEACARLQPAARRILMSGVADAAVVQEAKSRARIHEFVEKPMSARTLVDSIGRSAFRGTREPPRIGQDPTAARPEDRPPGGEGSALFPVFPPGGGPPRFG